MSAIKDLLTGYEETAMLWPTNWHTLPIYEWTPDGCACGRKCSSPGKHPRTKHGLKDASADREQHLEWLLRAPNASWAVRTGPESNLVVVDVDAGLPAWLDLTVQHGVPRTVTARSGSGGWHWYFQYPTVEVRNSVNRIAPGVDVRGLNGYVLLPGSTHRQGMYEWAPGADPSCVEVAPMPEWLIGMVAA